MEKIIISRALTDEELRFTYEHYVANNGGLESKDEVGKKPSWILKNKLKIMSIICIIAVIVGYSCVKLVTTPDLLEYVFAFGLFAIGFYNLIYLLCRLYLKLFAVRAKKRFFSGKNTLCKGEIYVEDGNVVIPNVRKYKISEIFKVVINNGYYIAFLNDGAHFFFAPKEDFEHDKLQSLFSGAEIIADDDKQGIIEKHKKRISKKNFSIKFRSTVAVVSLYFSIAVIHIMINHAQLPPNMAYREWVSNFQEIFYVLTSLLLLSFVIFTNITYSKLKKKGYKRKLLPRVFMIFTSIVMVLFSVIVVPLYLIADDFFIDREVHTNSNNTIIVEHEEDLYNFEMSYSLWEPKGYMYRILLKRVDELNAFDDNTKYTSSVKEVEEMNKFYNKKKEEDYKQYKKEQEIEKSKQKLPENETGEAVETKIDEDSIKNLLTYLKVPNTDIEYGAKGQQRAIIYQDEQVAKGIIYDKRSPNGNADIFVLYEFPKSKSGEFSYANGNILNTYAVNIKTGKVTPSGKKSWEDQASDEFVKETE